MDLSLDPTWQDLGHFDKLSAEVRAAEFQAAVGAAAKQHQSDVVGLATAAGTMSARFGLPLLDALAEVERAYANATPWQPLAVADFSPSMVPAGARGKMAAAGAAYVANLAARTRSGTNATPPKKKRTKGKKTHNARKG